MDSQLVPDKTLDEAIVSGLAMLCMTVSSKSAYLTLPYVFFEKREKKGLSKMSNSGELPKIPLTKVPLLYFSVVTNCNGTLVQS